MLHNMDRVPLEQAEKKVPESKPVEDQPRKTVTKEGKKVSRGTRITTTFISEFNDKQVLSTILGFDDNYFDGMGQMAHELYKWAKEEDGIGSVGDLVKELGLTEKGKPLLRKLAHWIKFDVERRKVEKIRDTVVESDKGL